ncbi:hypothetical protein BpHYR1_046695 [Brachionus plicatilis]|uniref:Uncharacterized protein n=1 Tax=Brachionus plicatilis TaxID=10195 RepID=A0A3M7RVR6_BRAPC|nr:hypothetical protein BpHYR1_046695 [Brachionus plicatilis]
MFKLSSKLQLVRIDIFNTKNIQLTLNSNHQLVGITRAKAMENQKLFTHHFELHFLDFIRIDKSYFSF